MPTINLDDIVSLNNGFKLTAVSNISTATTLTTSTIIALIDTSSSAFTVTLPDAPNATNHYFIILDTGGNAGTNNITIDTDGASLITGESSVTITNNYNCLTLFSEGSNWISVNSNSSMLYNTTANNVLSLTNGHIMYSSYVSNNTDWNTSSLEKTIYLTSDVDNKSDIITLACSRVTGTASETMLGSINWTEFQT